MKLVICIKCNDIFNLRYEKKTCSCGQTWGHYLEDGLHAKYGGPCLPLGFANGSFITALRNQPEKDWGKDFTAFVIQKECPTMERIGEAPVIPKPQETETERLYRLALEMGMSQAAKNTSQNKSSKSTRKKVAKKVKKK